MITHLFRHLSVRTKLNIAFGTLIALMVALAAFALLGLQQAHATFSSYVHGLAARATVAGHIRDAVDRRAIAARNLIFLSNPEDVAIERKKALEASTDVAQQIARLRSMLAEAPDATKRAHALFADIEKIEQGYAPVAAEIVALAAAGRQAEAQQHLQERCRPLLEALVAATGEYARFTEARAQQLTDEATQSLAHRRDTVIGLCGLALAVAVAAASWITRNISRGLTSAVDVANAIATGDLAQPIDIRSADEIGRLLEALGRMQDYLNSTVLTVRSNAESVATASAQIAQGNHDLSHRTEEQASALQQTAASMEQLSHAVRQNADSAQEANALATQTSNIASRCGIAVGDVVSSMQQIQGSAHRISDIVGVIDSIAFQTNILALNAAVEAARAGEQGRGFSVVAAEVRVLAKRSADAAREIKTLITSSMSEIQRGAALSDGAGATMQEVVAAVGRVSTLMGEINAACQEQSAGVGQIGAAVNLMDGATQRNAALVEESAAAASSLQHQAEQLLSAVAIFTCEKPKMVRMASLGRGPAYQSGPQLALT